MLIRLLINYLSFVKKTPFLDRNNIGCPFSSFPLERLVSATIAARTIKLRGAAELRAGGPSAPVAPHFSLILKGKICFA